MRNASGAQTFAAGMILHRFARRCAGLGGGVQIIPLRLRCMDVDTRPVNDHARRQDSVADSSPQRRPLRAKALTTVFPLGRPGHPAGHRSHHACSLAAYWQVYREDTA
jgi:hypothetical protein